MQGVYGYGMDIGIIEPSLPADPLDAHNSPVSFPQKFPQASPAVPAPSLQLSARGMPFVSTSSMPYAAPSMHLVIHAAATAALQRWQWLRLAGDCHPVMHANEDAHRRSAAGDGS